jgi:uncharacterized lipoprotein YddW (UPF0748 family)
MPGPAPPRGSGGYAYRNRRRTSAARRPPLAARRGAMLGAVGLLTVLLVASSVLALNLTVEPSGGAIGEPAARLLEPAPAPTCAGRKTTADRQLRAMWLTTVSNIDWPSRPGLDAEAVKAEYRGWLDLAQRLNHNAVFVHVRPSGDAFWQSEFAPWSQWLTGRTDGQSPGWDPMAFMVTETHARNMEFHAWFNPYKASQAGRLADLPPNHPLRQHPDWAVTYPASPPAARLYYNPGVPEARVFVEDSILEAVTRYDIDGVHFDDFFYPYPSGNQDFPDQATYARYGAGASKDDWRRQNVNLFVQEMNARIKELKPWVKFGISPFGIWRNQATDRRGSATSGLQSYDAIYADTRLWVRKGWLDYVVPQLYWHIGFAKADYAKLLPWWSSVVQGTSVQLYIGQADYRVGEAGAWRDPGLLDRQLALNRRYPVSGSIHFSATQVRADKLGSVSRYRAAHYAAPALVPAMTHLPGVRPPAPVVTEAHRNRTGAVTVAWQADHAARHAVYRVDLTTEAPAELVGTVGEGSRAWADTAAVGQAPRRRYAYCVTGLDRLWNEGPASIAHVAS